MFEKLHVKNLKVQNRKKNCIELVGNRTKRSKRAYKFEENVNFFCTFDVGSLKIRLKGYRKK